MTYAITYFLEQAYDLSGVELFEREVMPALADREQHSNLCTSCTVGEAQGEEFHGLVRTASGSVTMGGVTANRDFDTYRLSEDHEVIREAVRAVAQDKIAPHAAEVDELARYPQEAHDALVASDFFAPHVRGVRRWGGRARDVHRHRGDRAGVREQRSSPP